MGDGGDGFWRPGRIPFASAAEFALHLVLGAAPPGTRDQLGQTDEILGTERAATSSHGDEDVWRGRVGPRRGQRLQSAIVVEEEGAVLAPRLAQGHEHELPPVPRVERVRHPDSSVLTRRIGWG